MKAKVTAAALAAVLASMSGGACAMSSTPAKMSACQVAGSAKLPAEAGTANEICAAILAATNAKAPDAQYSVELRVLSASSLSATVRLANGQSLPEQKMTVNDRQLNRGSINRFAAAIASEIARADAR